MLGKILLTALVIITAYFYVRQRNMSEARQSSASKHEDPPGMQEATKNRHGDSSSLGEDLRLGAYMFLALTIGLGCALYYFDWQDDHTLLTITLHSDNQAGTVTYQVYKYQLGERSFTTLDGLVVTVASSERMEVQGLNQ